MSEKFKITEDIWPRIHTMASKCTIDTKARIFQVKILNNVLYLNKQLYKTNLSEGPLCRYAIKSMRLLHIYSLNAVTRLIFT